MFGLRIQHRVGLLLGKGVNLLKFMFIKMDEQYLGQCLMIMSCSFAPANTIFETNSFHISFVELTNSLNESSFLSI